jgi:hypothetical protein
MNILHITEVWWPFGAHLLGVKDMIACALANGFKYIYKYNKFLVFHDQRVETYYELIANCTENDLINPENKIYSLNELLDLYPYKKCLSYLPENFKTIEAYQQYLMKLVYKPNKMVKSYIQNNKLLNYLKDRAYIGLHIRLSDKVAGPAAETLMIPIEKYMDQCSVVRNKLNINDLVLCSDTIDAIDKVIELNKYYKFNVLYNQEETRCINDWTHSIVQRTKENKTTHEELKKDYMNCFINMELLLKSTAIVGNFDSGFVFSAVLLRNNPIDSNVNDRLPIFSVQSQIK